jgi:hypothetical protein
MIICLCLSVRIYLFTDPLPTRITDRYQSVGNRVGNGFGTFFLLYLCDILTDFFNVGLIGKLCMLVDTICNISVIYLAVCTQRVDKCGG